MGIQLNNVFKKLLVILPSNGWETFSPIATLGISLRSTSTHIANIKISTFVEPGVPVFTLVNLAKALLPIRRGSTVLIVDARFGIQTNNQTNNQTTVIRVSAGFYLYINS